MRHDVRAWLMGAVRGTADRRLRAGPHGSGDNDVDERDFPAETRGGRGCGGQCAGEWVGESGEYSQYVCAVFGVGGGCGTGVFGE